MILSMKTTNTSSVLMNNATHLLYWDGMKYVAFEKCRGFMQEVARSWILCSKVTKFFTNSEIRMAKARIHAKKLVDRKFHA